MIKPVVNSIVRPVVNSIVRPVVRGIVPSFSRNWTPLTLVVEDAAPTHVVITFPSAKTVLASDFTIAGFTVNSGSWTGSVYTLVLSTAVADGDSLIVVYAGISYPVTNNVLWNPSNIMAKFLYRGKISTISGGHMLNKIAGSLDYITIGGSAGSYTFQVPNTSTYKNADTDNIWFKIDTSQRTVTEAELIGYDFPKTFVKYDNTTPYTIREIWILALGQILTTDEENLMRDFCQLSIWWSNVLSSHGYPKQNRGIGKSVWVPE